jgi:hypothetical protein
MWINLADISENVQAEFNVRYYALKDRVMMEVVKGLYVVKGLSTGGAGNSPYSVRLPPGRQYPISAKYTEMP